MNYNLKKDSVGAYIDSTEKSVAVYFYGDSTSATKRAEDSTADELTGQTNTYKFCSLYDSATEIEAVTSTEEAALQSITYNNLIESGATADREKGEEVADYTMNYNLKKDSVGAYIASTEKSVAVYFYGDSTSATKRAEDATADELTGQTNTYKFCSLYDSATEIEAVHLNRRGSPPVDHLQ